MAARCEPVAEELVNTKAVMTQLKDAMQDGRCLAVLPSPSRETRGAGLLLERDSLQHGLGRMLADSPQVPFLLFGYSGRLFEIDLDERLAVMTWLAESFQPSGLWVAGARSGDELARMLALGLHHAFVLMVDFPIPPHVPIDYPELTLIFRSAHPGLDPSTWEPCVSRMAAYKDDHHPHAFDLRVADQLAAHRIPIVVGSVKFGAAPVPSHAAAIASSYGFCCAQSLSLGPTRSKLPSAVLAVLAELDTLRSVHKHKLIDALWSIHWDLAGSHRLQSETDGRLRALHAQLDELEKRRCAIVDDLRAVL